LANGLIAQPEKRRLANGDAHTTYRPVSIIEPFGYCRNLSDSLHRSEGPSDPLNQEILQLCHVTVPGSVRIVEPLQTVRRPEYASARWEFKVDSSWSSYKEWIVRNLPEGYQDLQKSESLLRFRKVLLGDVYRMDIQKLTSRNSVRIRVEFLAMPF
jgi:hypothetical protein